MRILLPTLAFALLAAPALSVPALAGSIEPLAGATSAGSIQTITCPSCPALKPKYKPSTYHVDAIAPGTQKIEIRDVNGERKIFRTEAWMGGSPVLFVTKAPAERVEAAEDDKGAVDTGARTGALDTSAAGWAATAAMASSQEFDPSEFELRLN